MSDVRKKSDVGGSGPAAPRAAGSAARRGGARRDRERTAAAPATPTAADAATATAADAATATGTASADTAPAVPDYDLEPTVVADTPAQLKALADPVRNAILHLVLERAATTSELAEALARPNGTVDHHLKVLERAGLVRVVRTRKVRAMTERFWGRTGRTILIARDDLGEGTKTGFLAEAMANFRPGEPEFVTLRYARIAPERAAEFARRLDELAVEFAAQPRSGSTVHGLLLALAPTDQPVLKERRDD